jgi:uncharacterized membrane protein YhaH (DUF805 family)
MIEAYLALSGRIRRWRFFVYWLFLWIIMPVLALLGIPMIDNARYPFAASVIVVIGLAAFWTWAGMALAVKRLHDLDKSGWHYVWMFLLPGLLTGGVTVELRHAASGQWSVGYGQVLGIIPLLATLYLIFARGSDGPNKFGYPP